MIPFKKLLALPAPPCTAAPIDNTKITAEGAERNIGGKPYYEFTYYALGVETSFAAIRAFTDGKEVRIYNCTEEKQSSGFINNVPIPEGRRRYDYNTLEYLTVIDAPSAKKTAKKIFGKYNSLYTSNKKLGILQNKKINEKTLAERAVCEARLKRAEARLTEYDYNEFRDFIKEVVTPEHYIFQFRSKKGGKLGYCTYCERWVNVSEGIKHNEDGTCPECGCAVKYKDMHRGHGSVYHRGLFFTLDKIGDEAVALRTFETLVDYSSVSEYMTSPPELKVRESTRHYINFEGVNERYELKYDWKGKEYTWQRVKRFDGNSSVYYSYCNAYCVYMQKKIVPNELWLYRPASAAALHETKLKYVDVFKDCRRYSDYRVDALKYSPQFIIMQYFKYPVYEYLFKANALQLTKVRTFSHSNIKIGAKTVSEIFCGLPQRIVKELLSHDPSVADISNAAALYNAGITPTWETLKKYGPVCVTAGLLPKIRHLDLLIEKFRQYKYNSILYGDYIEDCIKLGYDLTDKYVEFPKDLTAAHAKTTALIQVKTHQRENDRIIKREQTVNKEYFYENDVYLIRAPHDVPDFISEGSQQNNCVATNYMQSYSNSNCIIMFLRKKSDPEKSYITVEIRNYKIVQYYRKGNRTPKEMKDKGAEEFRREYENAILIPLINKTKERASK